MKFAFVVFAFVFEMISQPALCKIIAVTPTGDSLYDLSSTAVPGDIFELASGTYTKSLYLSGLSGNASYPITIRPASGATVVLDGSSYQSSSVWFSKISYINIEGPIEIKNTKEVGCGFGLMKSSFVNVRNLNVHHVWGHGITVTGSDILIENCIVHDCVLGNEAFKDNNTGGWGSCLNTDRPTSSELSHRIVFQNNTVYNGFGEGIDLIFCSHCASRNNVIHDTYSCLQYLDNVEHSIVEGNLIYVSDNQHNRSKNRPTGIAIGTENYSGYCIPDVNITIRNNIVIDAGEAVGYFSEDGTNGYYQDIHVIHNTFINPKTDLMVFTACHVSTGSSGNELSNNVFISDSTSLFIDNAQKASWNVFSNAWIGTSSVLWETNPGTSVSSNNKDKGVYWTFGNECNGIPEITPECYRPTHTSPLYHSGLPSTFSKPTDFFGDTWDSTQPSIGFADKPPNTCSPKTCLAMNHNCGTWNDGCGTDLNCGSCTSPYSCNTTSGICSCIPQTCASLGYLCGTPFDGCNTILNCGTCDSPKTCYYGNCSMSCTPNTCLLLGIECDNAQDGCGNTLNCGSCSLSSRICINGICKDKSVNSSSDDNNKVSHSNKLSINSVAFVVLVVLVVLVNVFSIMF